MRPNSVIVPYCGLPPDPNQLWSRWNLDPVLIAILLLFLLGYSFGAPAARRRGWIDARNMAVFGIGWLFLSLALISPLCALSVSLFAARAGQHMLIVLIAVPLLAGGRPGAVARTIWTAKHTTAAAEPHSFIAALGASAAFAIALWFWHMPSPYAATFASDTVYWAMHITMIASALWLWSVLLAQRRGQAVPVIATGLVGSMQMSLLGAVITFSSHPLYTPHLFTTNAWGITQMVDQQLGGAIMWVPGGAIFLTASIIALWSVMGTDQSRQAVRLKAR